MAALGKVSSFVPRLAAGLLAGAFAFASPPVTAQPAAPPKSKPSKPAAPQNTKTKPPSPVGPKSSESPAPPSPTPVPAPPKLPSQPPVDTSTPPPMLPRASRERMRSCAEEWDRMKRAKKITLTWREFATDCLTR